MKTPYPFDRFCLAGIFVLVWLGLVPPLSAQRPRTIRNADGTSTKVEDVDFGKPRGEDDNKPGEGVGDPEDLDGYRPFEGKGERRTTTGQDGDPTKVEFAQGGVVRRAVFFSKEGETIIVTEIDYGPDGKPTGQDQSAFDGKTHGGISREWQTRNRNGETTSGARTQMEGGKWVDYEWDPISEKWVKMEGYKPPSSVVSPPRNLDGLLKHRYGIEGFKGRQVTALPSSDKVKIDIFGTGQTIGHVAMMSFQNMTGQPIAFTVPAMILESRSGKNQNYGCPSGQKVALKPRQLVSVRIDGVCLNRNKPPVRYGVTGDLIIIDGNPTTPRDPGSKISATQAAQLIQICSSKYDAVEKLVNSDALKDFPYKDKKKQKDILVQWSTWSDPAICAVAGAPPATKEDLKKVVYKQLGSEQPMTPETQKKVDQGIDQIFAKVELANKKAKDLEETAEEEEQPVTEPSVEG